MEGGRERRRKGRRGKAIRRQGETEGGSEVVAE